ncbi:MAG: hypothetical protein DHS20C18_36560 [Saprospiraceae bacterium]|nr:MAG: hypothetical protein DHS20C18_36560 [Saprospiraceae bacterium]
MNSRLQISIKYVATILFLCLCCSSGQAQEPEKEDDVTIIRFGEEHKEVYSSPSSGINIKTGPLSFLSGKLLVEVEKGLGNLISVQGGVGITFRAIYDGYSTVQELGGERESFCDSEQWANDLCDVYRDFDIRDAKIGPYLHASARLFFDNEGFEGAYISPSLTYSVNRFKVQKGEIIAGELTRLDNVFQNEYERRLDFSMRYGNQWLYPKLSVEAFIGLGIRKVMASRQDLGYDEQNILQNGERKYANSDVLVELGFRVGFLL